MLSLAPRAGGAPAAPAADVLRGLGDFDVAAAPGEDAPAVLATAPAAVEAVLRLVRAGRWRIGVGAGPVLGADGGGAGAAFLSARRAVDAAGRRASGLAVRGAVPADAADAQAVLTALAALAVRRSEPAWAAIALVAAGRTQAAAAAELGITRQAVGQRLAAAAWELEVELRPTAARLLDRAAG